jgi:hypothetical protein
MACPTSTAPLIKICATTRACVGPPGAVQRNTGKPQSARGYTRMRASAPTRGRTMGAAAQLVGAQLETRDRELQRGRGSAAVLRPRCCCLARLSTRPRVALAAGQAVTWWPRLKASLFLSPKALSALRHTRTRRSCWWCGVAAACPRRTVCEGEGARGRHRESWVLSAWRSQARLSGDATRVRPRADTFMCLLPDVTNQRSVRRRLPVSEVSSKRH